MRIQIGLLAHSNAWEQLCAQEGVPWTVVDVARESLGGECSILVVNKMLSGEERNAVESYLKNGGAVIGWTTHLHHVAGVEGTEQDMMYLVSDHDDVFPSVHLLDVGIRGVIPKEANALRTNTGTFAIAVGQIGGGWRVVLPFDVEALLHDPRSANKSFYFISERLPSERVSLVAKGELLHLIHEVFKFLHHVRQLPYAHLWYFPNGLRNIFAFRVDTDRGTREDVDTLYKLARESNISMSWFLDVKNHEPWIDHFKHFVGQEIGLHCYEHQTYPTFDANLRNITKGVQKMRRSGLQPVGFTAPYGVWNSALAKTIDETGFEYSSEFSYAYDTLPLFAWAEGIPSCTLQIPIHPICIGSMLKVGYSDATMIEYFERVIRLKLSRNEPLCFYHHPLHRRWNVVRWLLSLRLEGVGNLAMGEYASWWKRRIAARYAVEVTGSEIQVARVGTQVPEDVWMRIIRPEGQEVVLPCKERIDLDSVVDWRSSEKPFPPPEDIRRAREFDPRQMVGQLYDSLRRRLR